MAAYLKANPDSYFNQPAICVKVQSQCNHERHIFGALFRMLGCLVIRHSAPEENNFSRFDKKLSYFIICHYYKEKIHMHVS